MDIITIGFKADLSGLKAVKQEAKDTAKALKESETATKAKAAEAAKLEKVIGRTALALEAENRTLMANVEGTKEAAKNAELFNLQQKLLAQGLQGEQLQALLRVKAANLELAQGLKETAAEQKLADQVMRDATKQIQMQERAMERLNQQSLKEGRALLAAHRKEVEAEERAFSALHQEALKMNNTVDKLNGNLQAERLRIKALKEGTASARVEYKLFNIEREASKTLSGSLLQSYMQEQRALLRTEEAVKLVAQRKRRLNRVTEESTKEMRKNSVRLSQASIQFEQFFNQLQGGANPLLAFSQQAADLGIVLGFGLAGAVVGIAGAFVSLLGPALLDMEDKTKKLDESMGELNNTFSRTSSGMGVLSDQFSTLRLRDESLQQLTIVAALHDTRRALIDTDEALEDFIEGIDALETVSVFGSGFGLASFDRMADRIDALSLSFDDLVDSVNNFDRSRIILNNFTADGARLTNLVNDVDQIRERFDLTVPAALKLGDALGNLQNNVTFENIDQLESTLLEIVGSSDSNSLAFQKLTKDMLVYINSAKDAAAANKLLRQEAMGVDTSLRFELGDSIEDIIGKINRVGKEMESASSGALQVYLDMNTRLNDELVKLSNETFVKYISGLERSISVFADMSNGEITMLRQSREEMQALAWEVENRIRLTDEQREKLIELFRIQAQDDAYNNYFNATEALQDQIGVIELGAEAVTRMQQARQNELQVQRLYELGLVEEAIALEALFEKYQKISNERAFDIKNQSEFSESLMEISNIASDLGDSFDGLGSRIANAFSEGTAALSEFSDRSFELGILQEQNSNNLERFSGLTEEQKQSSKEYLQLKREEEVLQSQITQNQLSGISSLLGASKNLFDEQSKEREALHRAEIAFSAVELALTLQRSIAKAKEAIASAYAAPFPLGFAAGAAMIAAMTALLGGSFGGGGSASAPTTNTGTGTVFGDSEAQSDSISASQEMFEDIQLDQLAELRGIRSGLSNLANSLGNLTRSVIAGSPLGGDLTSMLGTSGQFDSGGLSGPLGAGIAGAAIATFTGGLAAVSGGLSIVATAALDAITGGLVSDLLDGIIGGIFGGSVSTELEDSGIKFMTQTFRNIFESGELQAEAFNLLRVTEDGGWFGSDDVSFQEVTSQLDQNIRRELGAVFGFIGETAIAAAELLGVETVTVVQTVIDSSLEGVNFDSFEPNMARLMGEFFNVVTTSTEMSLQDALNAYQIQGFNLSLEGLTGEEIERELEAVFSQQADLIAEYLVPSITQFQRVGEGAFETLQRVARETVAFESALDKLGGSFSGTRDELISFGQSVLELFGGVDEFNSVMASYVDNFFTEQERLEFLTNDLARVFESLGLVMPTTNKGFRELVTEFAGMGEEGAETLTVLLQINEAFAQMTDMAANLTNSMAYTSGEFVSLVELMSNLRFNRDTEFFQGFTQSPDAMRALAELVGGEQAFSQVLQSIANNFGDAVLQMDVAQEVLASSITGIQNLEFIDAAGESELIRNSGTEAVQELIDLRNTIRSMSSTSEDVSNDFMALVNSLTGADISTGLFEQVLAIEGAVSNYVNALRQQEEAALAAAEAEAALQEERNNRTLDLQIQLLRAQGNELEAVSIERMREIETLREYDEQNGTNLETLQSLIFLQEDYNQALEESQSTLSSVFDVLRTAVDAQRDSILQTINDLEIASERLSGAIRQQDVNVRGGMDVAMRELNLVLEQARGGDLSGVSSLDLATLTAGDTANFSTRAEFNLAQARIATQLEELKALTDAQVPIEERVLEELEKSFELAEQQFNELQGITENQVQQLIDDEQYAAATEQAFADFIDAANNTNGILALQDGNEQERFQSMLDLQQVLADANDINFAALLSLTDDQRQQIVDNLNALTIQTSNLDVNLSAQVNASNMYLSSIDGNIMELITRVVALDQTTLEIADKAILSELKNLSDITLKIVDKALLAELQNLSDITLKIVDKAILSELEGVNSNIRGLSDITLKIVDKAILSQLEELTQTTLEIVDKAILKELESINSSIKTMSDITLKIVDKAILKELERINENIQLIGGSDGSTSSPSMNRYLEAIEFNTRSFVDTLINDDRRKVSLPNSHYNNQQAMITELKAVRRRINVLIDNNNQQNRAIVNNTNETADLLQRIEINGLDVRQE